MNNLYKYKLHNKTCTIITFIRRRSNQSVVRGHHINKEVWRPVIGQELPVLSEPNNHRDRRAVAICMDGEVESKWVNGNSHSMSVSRMVNGNAECKFYEKQCHVWYFYSPFHISSALPSGYLQSDPRSHHHHMLTTTLVHLWNISSLTPHFQEQCASYWGSTQILSRRQHVPNKQCALNNDVRLITWFYSSMLYLA